ncbi:MAG TPA: class I SAM-dependent methyltransferase [Candidatus Binatia bacterium]|nr:class I SAM-dependent methyltransferase [Candidatus Binatia bacterium]
MSRGGPDDQKTPDDSPVGLYLAIGTEGEPELIHSVIPAGASVLDLGSGVGRIAHPLIELGHPVVAVDESAEMLAHVHGAETVRSRIEDLDLGRTFDCVLMMSNLVNTSDDRRRASFLRTCRRHVAEDGAVLIERYDPKLRVREGISDGVYGGVGITLERRGEGGRGSWKLMYTHPDGRTWTQEGKGAPHVLDDDQMRAALAVAGLEVARTFGPKRRWVLARPVSARASSSRPAG